MKKILSVLLFLMIIPLSLISQEVFVWDFDNGYTVPNLDEGGDYGIQEGVVNALEANSISPTVDTTLPSDLSMYDIVFVIGGIWCYS